MNRTYVTDIATALSEKHVALMVGAGFSKNAEKLSATDRKFLNWNELSDKFYNLVYENSKAGKEYCSSLRLAQEVETVLGRPKLESILKDSIPDLDYGPSNLYTGLMELPWVDVFTTNYDTLLERAADNVTTRRYNVVVSQEDLVNSNDAPRIIKLHGSFPSHRPFIITEEDYRTYPVKFAALVNTVQQALLENVFCMIGFSCEDPNFLKWIGWIHDNLGRSSSQKIYMISVNHAPEATIKMLSEQNIVVVDLDELYPSLNISERIDQFLKDLKAEIDNKDSRDNWFDINCIHIKEKADIKEYTLILQKLNDSYPGWIYLPWKMKERTDYILIHLKKSLFDQGTEEEQILYIYEYLRFCEIVGRPLLAQSTMAIWEKLTNDSFSIDSTNYKVQFTYLRLLRSFRELAQWDNYDCCKGRIQENILTYDDKQFLYACDWWKYLYKFEADGISDKLDQWQLSKGDLYWPLIKASMYAIIGSFSKAEDILMKNLVLVRQKLFKSQKKEYLCSIEDSCVSLFNFIKQRNFSMETLEKCVNQGDISWWDENEKYYLRLNIQDEIKADGANTNFDLSTTYTTHFGTSNESVFYALEYLRFIEQSGHPFRLGNVTNTRGLVGTIKRLVQYYPHWCLMQMLIAQDDKHLDLFFGRAQLGIMTQKEVDSIANDYVKILRVLLQRVEPQNYFFSASIYEQSAAVVPYIVARLCYKCSTAVLDSILDLSLDILHNRKRVNFKGIKYLLKGLIGSYTEEQQVDRIEKILMFPIVFDIRNEYIDPIHFLSVFKKKIVVKQEVYEDCLYEIKKMVVSNEPEQRECAINRLIYMYQLVQINENDEKWLFKLLVDSKNDKYKEILYFLKPDSKKDLANDIFNDTISRLKNDSQQIGTFSGGGLFGNVFSVLNDINIASVNYIETIKTIKAFAQKNYDWSVNGEAKNRLYLSLLLFIRLTIKRVNLSKEELDKALEILTIYKNYYSSAALTLFRYDFLENTDPNDIDASCYEKMWLSETTDIDLLRDYYNIVKIEKIAVDPNLKTCAFWNKAFEFSTYQATGKINDGLLSSLELCYSLLKYKTPEKTEIQLLLCVMDQLIYKTTITHGSSEAEAISHLKCRIQVCEIASFLYGQGFDDKVIFKWKEIIKSEDEFSEIKKIVFLKENN
ncbi:MAG: SIR2 family protein [Clostridiaceae bacterium]|nr:SIR2 family protein [Clostridiaceae bacterium]